MHLVSSPWTMLCCAKALQTYWNITNFMLLLAVSALVPFAVSMRSMLMAIPCPRMAALVSNTALIGVFGILWMMGWFVYKNIWVSYVYVMTIWPWLAVASMVARLYVGRDQEVNQSSPLSHLPALALAGVTSHILALLSLKDGLTLTDCVALCTLDPLLSAIIYGPVRRDTQYSLAKLYVVLVLLMVSYFAGESSGMANGGFGTKHLMYAFQQNECPKAEFGESRFLGGRALLTLRSAFVKYSFTRASEGASEPDPAPMDESLWVTTSAPRKHRFSKFPGPILYRLDVIFDSGLADVELHGVGPLGTKDLLLMSDFTYLLPLASLMSWIADHMGRDTLKFGLMPPETPDQLDTITVGGAADFVSTSSSGSTTALIIVICGIFGVSYLLSPWSTARSLFDQGSAVHTWSARPVGRAVLEWFQLIVAILGIVVVLFCRHALWKIFTRRYLLKLTQELKFHQPSALREPQKRALLDFLYKMSVDDYQLLLLETSIHHGNNVREILRAAARAKLTHHVWDPRPSATAAWKLAVSLVVKAMKKQQSGRRVQVQGRMEMLHKIRDIILSAADHAVDAAEGHGMRLLLAKEHAVYAAKKRAIRSLRRNMVVRRSLRDKINVARSLSKSAMLQATSLGVMRALSDLEVAMVVILTFGDNNYGQLGVMRESLAEVSSGCRQKASHVMTVDVLRGKDCIQVETGGDSSFAMTAQGRVYAWGSNRWGQLGMRPDTGDFVSADVIERGGVKGVRMKETPDMVKLMREVYVVQVASSPTSSTGQTHTLMLAANGHVYSCGTQTEGAMGLGYEATINQTPSIVRLTASHPIVQVACGSRHSLLLSDIGVVWACGDNKRGQLGVGGCKHSATPVIVEVLSGVRLLTCGEAHSIASTFDPATLEEMVYAWGANSSGQLGIGSVHDQFIPKEVQEIQMFRNRPEGSRGSTNAEKGSPSGYFVSSIAAGGEHTVMAICRGRVVVSFGSNALGQLGVGRNSEGRDVTRCSPSVVPPLSHKDGGNIVMCAAAAMHSIFLDASGETFVCGDNT
ncbi:hypothetical protein FOL46_004602 [Perkinsus olseni]|uniref:RCC1-like domain-containing protein n=1 Tax=Perkinsus olseni TaxID=32597 RepID=A0A7J6LX00_PEROL|nr:hypothetical protein FOL46_004602 [Perkinsus olseni]